MYAVIYGDMENGENIEVEGLFRVFNFCGGQTFALNIWGSWKQHL